VFIVVSHPSQHFIISFFLPPHLALRQATGHVDKFVSLKDHK